MCNCKLWCSAVCGRADFTATVRKTVQLAEHQYSLGFVRKKSRFIVKCGDNENNHATIIQEPEAPTAQLQLFLWSVLWVQSMYTSSCHASEAGCVLREKPEWEGRVENLSLGKYISDGSSSQTGYQRTGVPVAWRWDAPSGGPFTMILPGKRCCKWWILTHWTYTCPIKALNGSWWMVLVGLGTLKPGQSPWLLHL